MLHMQHAQLSLLLMERSRPKKLEFPSEDREHQRQLERVGTIMSAWLQRAG